MLGHTHACLARLGTSTRGVASYSLARTGAEAWSAPRLRSRACANAPGRTRQDFCPSGKPWICFLVPPGYRRQPSWTLLRRQDDVENVPGRAGAASDSRVLPGPRAWAPPRPGRPAARGPGGRRLAESRREIRGARRAGGAARPDARPPSGRAGGARPAPAAQAWVECGRPPACGALPPSCMHVPRCCRRRCASNAVGRSAAASRQPGRTNWWRHRPIPSRSLLASLARARPVPRTACCPIALQGASSPKPSWGKSLRA